MFSFQSAFVSFVYLKQPIYYITVFWFCQVLFQKFLWFFYLVFKSIYCFIQSIPIGFLYSFGRLIYYITYLSFCQVLFSTFFKIFLWLSLSSNDLFIIAYPDAFCQYGNSHNDKLTHHNNFVISVIQVLKIWES